MSALDKAPTAQELDQILKLGAIQLVRALTHLLEAHERHRDLSVVPGEMALSQLESDVTTLANVLHARIRLVQRGDS